MRVIFSLGAMRDLRHRAITALTATVIGRSAVVLTPTTSLAQTYFTDPTANQDQHQDEPYLNNSWGPSNVPKGVDPGPTEKQTEQSRAIGKCVLGAGLALVPGPETWPAAAKLAGTGCVGTLAMDALD